MFIAMVFIVTSNGDNPNAHSRRGDKQMVHTMEIHTRRRIFLSRKRTANNSHDGNESQKHGELGKPAWRTASHVIPFTGNCSREKTDLWWQKAEQWLPGEGGGEASLGGRRVWELSGVLRMFSILMEWCFHGTCICQDSELLHFNFTLCKLYFEEQKMKDESK